MKPEPFEVIVEFTPQSTKTGITYEMHQKGSLIRCENCKFVGTDATCCLVCNRDGMGLRPFHVYHDDYCSYAERKEEHD